MVGERVSSHDMQIQYMVGERVSSEIQYGFGHRSELRLDSIRTN